jgi:FK506-binding nuclear protein
MTMGESGCRMPFFFFLCTLVLLYRRFEEVPSSDDKEKKGAEFKGKKRPVDAMDEDDKEAETALKLSKAQKKALKKQKGENGQAVPITPETKSEKKKDKKEKEKDKVKEGATAAGPGDLQELPGGIKYRDVKIGDGANAKKGSTVKMRYIGKLNDGTIFDSNTKGKPVSHFHLHFTIVASVDSICSSVSV